MTDNKYVNDILADIVLTDDGSFIVRFHRGREACAVGAVEFLNPEDNETLPSFIERAFTIARAEGRATK